MVSLVVGGWGRMSSTSKLKPTSKLNMMGAADGGDPAAGRLGARADIAAFVVAN